MHQFLCLTFIYKSLNLLYDTKQNFCLLLSSKGTLIMEPPVADKIKNLATLAKIYSIK